MRAFEQLFNGGVRHHARELDDFLAGGSEGCHNIVVDAVTLDGTAAIGEQHLVAYVCERFFKMVARMVAEIQFCRVGVDEIS